MPITETDAKLWHETKEQRDAYDDDMIANIELKSLDFDDENFSPVFNRSTQEFFLEAGERYKSDFNKVLEPFKSHSFEEYVDKYVLLKPNHTYYRNLPFEKFGCGFVLGYFLLRELPLRNFYARCLVMTAFAAKYMDNFKTPWSLDAGSALSKVQDQYTGWEVRCYDTAWRAMNFIEVPTAANRLKEQRKWEMRQPGHLARSDTKYLPHYLTAPFRSRVNATWDGTNNQPLHRLADPLHKDSYMVNFNA